MQPHPPRRGRLWTADGFTLIELLVAMLFISVALTGLAALQIHSIRQVNDTRRAAEALQLAEAVLSRYANTVIPFPSLPQPLPPTPHWGEVYMKGAHAGFLSQMVNVAVDGESEGPFTVHQLVEQPLGGSGRWLVTVRVSWRQSTAGVDNPALPCNFPRRCVMVSMERSG